LTLKLVVYLTARCNSSTLEAFTAGAYDVL